MGKSPTPKHTELKSEKDLQLDEAGVFGEEVRIVSRLLKIKIDKFSHYPESLTPDALLEYLDTASRLVSTVKKLAYSGSHTTINSERSSLEKTMKDTKYGKKGLSFEKLQKALSSTQSIHPFLGRIIHLHLFAQSSSSDYVDTYHSSNPIEKEVILKKIQLDQHIIESLHELGFTSEAQSLFNTLENAWTSAIENCKDQSALHKDQSALLKVEACILRFASEPWTNFQLLAPISIDYPIPPDVKLSRKALKRAWEEIFPKSKAAGKSAYQASRPPRSQASRPPRSVGEGKR